MVEGGARTYGAFVRAGRVNRIHVYKAPIAIGELHGLKWSGNFDETEFLKRVVVERTLKSTYGRDEYWTAPVRA